MDSKKPLSEQLKAATAPNGGVNVKTPSGAIVQYPPGVVRLAADIDRGVYIEGLKAGCVLATDADIAALKIENDARDAERAASED